MMVTAIGAHFRYVILILMLDRLGVRLRHGAPGLPADMSPLLRFAAHANHYAFYGLLILLPLSGATALGAKSVARS